MRAKLCETCARRNRVNMLAWPAAIKRQGVCDGCGKERPTVRMRLSPDEVKKDK